MTTATLPRRLLAALLATLALVAGPLAAPAHAVTAVDTYLVDASVDAAGVLTVSATITPDGGAGDLVQRFATTLAGGGDEEYVFGLDGVRATIAGQDAGARVASEPGYQVVTIPTRGDEPLVLEYTVRGAAIGTGDETTLAWRLLQGLNVPVRTFEARVSVPGPFTSIDCAAGAPGYPGACSWYAGGTHDEPTPVFHDGPRGAGEVVQVVLRFPSDVVAPNAQVVQRWSLDRAFSAQPLPLGVAAALALLGGLAQWVAHRRFGRDDVEGLAPTPVAAFAPVAAGRSEFRVFEDVRPGHVGTLVDERVDPVDVAATILDLAVRGALVVRELPRATQFARPDWEFVRRDLPAGLRAYERTILDAVAPTDGAALRVSQLGAVVPGVIGQVQSELYDDVVSRGWFGRRPDRTRNAWTVAGWVGLAGALVVTGLLVAFTRFGLAGLVLVALAVGVGLVGQAMPSRTRRGASLLAGLGVLRGQLLTQPTDEMPTEDPLGHLSRLLPYAVVLGGTERWLDGMVAADGDEESDERDLAWYHGPEGWHLRDLPDSLRSFVTTLEGTLVER